MSAIGEKFAAKSAPFRCRDCVRRQTPKRSVQPPTDADEHGRCVDANFDLTSLAGGTILATVSATEIINELPKLTDAELRLVRQRLLELAAQNQDIELCNQAALDGAMMLDRMEDDDARRQSR